MIVSIIFFSVIYLSQGILIAMLAFETFDILRNKNPLLGIPVALMWPLLVFIVFICILYCAVIAYIDSVKDWHRKNGGKK